LRLHRRGDRLYANQSFRDFAATPQFTPPQYFAKKIKSFAKKNAKNVRKNEQILFFVLAKFLTEHANQILITAFFFFSQILLDKYTK
jgi:hypothetical protein